MQTPDLHLELRPTARMAPWTLQALHLLELGTADLSDFVEAALLENPLLEREEHPFESTYAATGVHYEDGPLPEPAGEEGDRLDTLPAILLEQLEAAGVADRTAIVLAGDHFPYGLSKEEYSELIGHETDYFERYKDTLIFWVGGLEKPIQVDEYCCNIDILPTILNLWGFDYDSRLLPGTDVFSDGTHVAILADQSFVTDKVKFNASSNTVEYQVDSDTLVPDYLRNMQQIVKNRFNASADILNKAYYNIVFDQGEVVVGDDAWISEADWNGTNHTGFQTNPDMPEEEDPILKPDTPETPVVPVRPAVDNRGSVIN